jgi:hypothetical protein
METLISLPTPDHVRLLSSIGWIESDLDGVTEWLRNQYSTVVFEEGPQNLRELLDLQSSRTGSFITLFRAPGWTGFLSNNLGGTDIGVVRGMTLTCRIALFTWETVENNFPGGRVFTVYDRHALPVRGVRVIRDGRWAFSEGGDPLPFEELDSYKAKRISDRLTPEHLSRYAAALGIPAQVDLSSSVLAAMRFTGPVEDLAHMESSSVATVVRPLSGSPEDEEDGIEVGQLVDIGDFFRSGPDEADLGPNLYPHPGIPFFERTLTDLAGRREVVAVLAELVDSGSAGIGFTDRVWVGSVLSKRQLTKVADELQAELLGATDLGDLPDGLPLVPDDVRWHILFWD